MIKIVSSQFIFFFAIGDERSKTRSDAFMREWDNLKRPGKAMDQNYGPTAWQIVKDVTNGGIQSYVNWWD